MSEAPGPTEGSDELRVALRQLSRFADLLMPEDADPPILAPAVRAALMGWIAELRAVDELAAVGLRPTRSALLFGPPGCGKTTFAHHFAARLGLPLACVRSESLINKYLGATGQNIGQLFDVLTVVAGDVVVFFDEVDALGMKRSHDSGASTERANSLNVILRRIERFDGICIAATNRQDVLDSALWRRFDMQVSIDLPGVDERFAILRRYGLPFAFGDDELDILAELTEGASPALLRGLMEGLKRAFVLWPPAKRPVDDPVAVVGAIVGQLSPAPEYALPPLWREPGAVERLAGFGWPPPREAA